MRKSKTGTSTAKNGVGKCACASLLGFLFFLSFFAPPLHPVDPLPNTGPTYEHRPWRSHDDPPAEPGPWHLGGL